jgi:hypothetical protein
MRRGLQAILFALSILGLTYLLNFVTLKMPVSDRLSEDERNEVVDLSVRYRYYADPSAIAISLNECSEAAPVDILRALLQTAEALQDRDFSAVELHSGYTHKFTLTGEYFERLGEEYDYQNPVYTARTLPEKLRKPDGTQAYYSLGGGLSGLSNQMENFSQFALDWCQ